MVMLSSAFINDSRQDEKFNIDKFDRHGSDTFYLEENNVSLYLFAYRYDVDYDEIDYSY